MMGRGFRKIDAILKEFSNGRERVRSRDKMGWEKDGKKILLSSAGIVPYQAERFRNVVSGMGLWARYL